MRFNAANNAANQSSISRELRHENVGRNCWPRAARDRAWNPSPEFTHCSRVRHRRRFVHSSLTL